MRLLRIVLSVVTVVLALYGLITRNFDLSPYMMLSLSTLLLIIGIDEIKKHGKASWGYINIIVSLFGYYVSIQGFLI
ncbi:DUF3953 domain-containing protein [Oceanobacillus sp. Castelsardo]|uniref:DUF3953 domain-containing protein n=1 Tax=Oceanobacillus sp. Castelsardo TaxID=1851204 RepID=UPI0008395B92|nr:DUF3953 domain-containing protein [Oceanobacillus sp. Castelsardo]